MGNDLSIYSRAQIAGLVKQRPSEQKLGERVQYCPPGMALSAALSNSKARFVLLGVPEDIGVRANGGLGGAWSVWEPALQALLNIQSTTRLSGEEILVLGAFDFSAWMTESASAPAEQLRDIVSRMDELIYPVIREIVQAGKIPVVIGGGHNNAFPLLKGASLAKGKAVNSINMDAHSDYRVMEGRHSGNGFRYAKQEYHLDRYAIIGLHENYNSEAVVHDLRQDPSIHISFFEDIFLRGHSRFDEAVQQAITHTSGTACGIELDLDCIEGVLSSAATPCGISALQARQYIHACAEQCEVAYLHLTEGALQLADGRKDTSTAKLIAYLVSDFIKGMSR